MIGDINNLNKFLGDNLKKKTRNIFNPPSNTKAKGYGDF